MRAAATNSRTRPHQAGYRQPAEWSPRRACWLAWPPPGEELWGSHLQQARIELADLCAAIAGPAGEGEQLEILVQDEVQEQQARRALGKTPARYHRTQYGDIWLRDTGPVFLKTGDGELACACFAFNGWGGRYVYPGDERVSHEIAKITASKRFDCDLVFEGGAVEADGEGSCIAARDCLLDPARNPGAEQPQVEEILQRMLGARRVLWLSGSLKNDHTDGHVDTLARFIAPGRVMCMQPTEHGDPNAAILQKVCRQLADFTDARGRKLELVRIPSPGLVRDDRGNALPASYLNYYLGNRTVVVPTYGSDRDEQAVEAVARAFPDRLTKGLSARAILQGGGAFHCITLGEPL